MFLQETYSIQDILYYNDGTKTANITYPSGVTLTSVDGALKIQGTTSGEKSIFYPPEFTSNDDFWYEIETVKTGTTNSITMIVKTGSTANGLWVNYTDAQSKYTGGFHGNSFNYSTSFNIGDKIRVTHISGVTSVYLNDTLMKSVSGSWSGTFQVGHYTNSGRVQYIDNVKIQKL